MRSIYEKIADYLFIFLSAFLLLAYVSVHINPEVFPYLSFLGIIYPILLFSQITFGLYYLLLKRKQAWVSAAILLLGANHIGDFVSLRQNEAKDSEEIVRLMTYNVRMFNHYLWIDDKETGNKIVELVKERKPDVLCMQEFYSTKDNDFLKKISQSYPYIASVISNKTGDKFTGNAIFSRYPIVNKGLINIKTSNRKCLFIDIKTGSDTLRVYNLHLASMHLNYADYDFIDGKAEQNSKAYFSLWLKLAEAYRRRAVELNFIIPHINSSPYKTIVSGDFNDPPMSYTYLRFSDIMTDAFISSGAGVGQTFTRFAPTFRIDYIWHDFNLNSQNFEVIGQELSDHYPVYCEILK